MREAPIILPVFTTRVPLDFPSEGTFAFNKKTHKQLEVTVRINEHQYFNMNFLNQDGYIMACCRWAHVLDFAENGYDRYEHIIKKLIWRKWDTTYLEERMKQEDEVTAKVEADQALVKKKSAEWKAIMEGNVVQCLSVVPQQDERADEDQEGNTRQVWFPGNGDAG